MQPGKSYDDDDDDNYLQKITCTYRQLYLFNYSKLIHFFSSAKRTIEYYTDAFVALSPRCALRPRRTRICVNYYLRPRWNNHMTYILLNMLILINTLKYIRRVKMFLKSFLKKNLASQRKSKIRVALVHFTWALQCMAAITEGLSCIIRSISPILMKI